MATAFLQKDEEARSNGHEIRHRNVSGHTVSKYQGDIETGNFPRTHQGVLVCDTGEVIDGRHRFYAIIAANKPIVSLVTDGITEDEGREMIKYIDGGRPRDIATQLWMSEGVEQTRLVVAAIRAQWCIATGRAKENGGSTSTVMVAFKAQSKSLTQIALIMGAHNKKIASSLVGPVAYYAYSHPKEAVEFATSFVTGEKLAGGSPVLWLKRTNETRTTKRQRHRLFEASLITCNALWAFHHEKKADALFRATTGGREWLIGESGNLTKILVETAPRYAKKSERWIPMGQPT